MRCCAIVRAVSGHLYEVQRVLIQQLIQHQECGPRRGLLRCWRERYSKHVEPILAQGTLCTALQKKNFLLLLAQKDACGSQNYDTLLPVEVPFECLPPEVTWSIAHCSPQGGLVVGYM